MKVSITFEKGIAEKKKKIMVRGNEESSYSFAKQIIIKLKMDSSWKEKRELLSSIWKYGDTVRIIENANDDEVKLWKSGKRNR